MINLAKIPDAEILSEQFIPDHVFVYLAKGTINCYDAHKTYTFKAGEYFIAQKNRLARYKIKNDKAGFEPVMFCFDEAFLRDFQQKHQVFTTQAKSSDTFLKIKNVSFISSFISSLIPYQDGPGKLNAAFEDLKYEELLLILLQAEPTLGGILFDFAMPEKIDLQKFMQGNFTFNVSIARFAFLTGRSLSAFKRDFRTVFNDTPNRWLVKKRLEEAHFLISKKGKTSSEIYLDLGFEDLSHFSFAFKKLFGFRPTTLGKDTNR